MHIFFLRKYIWLGDVQVQAIYGTPNKYHLDLCFAFRGYIDYMVRVDKGRVVKQRCNPG